MRNKSDRRSRAKPSKSPVFPLGTRSWDSAETHPSRGGGALTVARHATPGASSQPDGWRLWAATKTPQGLCLRRPRQAAASVTQVI